jgi:hypothetical protein
MTVSSELQEFEHDSYHGDEEMIGRPLEMGRLNKEKGKWRCYDEGGVERLVNMMMEVCRVMFILCVFACGLLLRLLDEMSIESGDVRRTKFA